MKAGRKEYLEGLLVPLPTTTIPVIEPFGGKKQNSLPLLYFS